MSKTPLSIAILWHQHQPYYKNNSGIYQMPWVRFHSTKDYLDLLLVLQEFPEVKQNYNLVPSLLLQIQDYAQNMAEDNIWVLTDKRADSLTIEDKKKILSHFFLANVNGMIKPAPRFYELYLKYKQNLKNEPLEKKVDAFSTDEYRDLQVWYNLCWIGLESRKREPLARLFKKGRNFTEKDKQVLLKESRRIMGDIVPAFRKMWDEGQIELSTTPFYHPILPLLCDNYIARTASPSLPLPQHRFSSPEDAEAQVVNGLNYFAGLFGRRPDGMWPSEGSVSLQALEIIARQGLKWVATDEGILSHTLKQSFRQEHIYQPYLLDTGRNQINILFRDHYLSDAIGFVYSNWPADRAVNDFMNRLHAIRNLLVERYGEKQMSRFVVPVILDGENCWEYYKDDGKPFLRGLYQSFSED
ncbi:MAG: glycoside hydrolase family 57 protein, partial [Calditrichia bacterium]